MVNAIVVFAENHLEVFRLAWQCSEHAARSSWRWDKRREKGSRRLVSGSHSTQFASRLIFELFIHKLHCTAKQHAVIQMQLWPQKLTNTLTEFVSSWICETNPKHWRTTGWNCEIKVWRLQDANPHNGQLQATWECALRLANMFYECPPVSVLSCHGSITLFSTVNGKNGFIGFSREQKVEIRGRR